MAYYPQYPQAFYAYPMPYPSQDFYTMYPPAPVDGQVYYDTSFKYRNTEKAGFNNRKESQDSGISDFSTVSSRKISTTSTISNSSLMEDLSLEEDVDSEEPFEVPNDELCVQIAQQVEFYFSDANITKDKFLLKHVKRNKEGFVSLKLISSFKRVKHLTKDWRQVAYAVEKMSDQLEVNDVKTKVRRLQALPEYDETTPSRTVVAVNLPMERPTIESVAELFSLCGEIVLIRILRPGNPVPSDVRPFLNKHPELSSKICALVEFERTEFALSAVREFHQEGEEKMKVMEMIAPPPVKTGKKAEDKKKALQMKQIVGQPQRRYSQGSAPPALSSQNHDSSHSMSQRRKISLMPNMKFATIPEEHQKAANLNPNAPVFTMQQRRLSKPSQPSSPAAHLMQQPVWMSRRVSGQHDVAASGLALPANVIRQPRGPDDTNGFQQWCKARMTHLNKATQEAPKDSKNPKPTEEASEDLNKATDTAPESDSDAQKNGNKEVPRDTDSLASKTENERTR